MREKVLEFEFSRAQLNEIEKRLVELSMKCEELKKIKESLEELRGGEGKDFLFSFAPGVFVRGRLMDGEKVLVEVGANIVMQKKLDEAKQFIDEQIEELERALQRLSSEYLILGEKLRKLAPEIEKLLAEK